MNFVHRLFTEEFVIAMGWTLLHSLWQGALLAILLGIALVLMRKYSSQTRYLVALITLSLVVIAVAVTFSVLYTPESSFTAESAKTATAMEMPALEAKEVTEDVPSEPDALLSAEREKGRESSILSLATGYFSGHLPLIVSLWLLGVVLLVLRFLGNLAYVERLKHYKTGALPPAWLEKAGAIADKMELRKRVIFLSSQIAPSPMAVGLLKPMVIIPARIISGLSEKEIEAILAHELAHILRNDFFVNIIQTFFEILFFYHPAVWWISATIRHERENCCDDIAITVTGESCDYAKTLIMLQEERLNQNVPAMAFSGLRYKFSHRIERIFNQPTLRADFKEGFVTALIFVGGILGITFNAVGAANLPESTPNETMTIINTDTQIDEESAEAPQLEPTVPFSPPVEGEEKSLDLTSEEMPEVNTTPTNSDLELLLEAIDDGNVQLVKYMLDKGVDVNASTDGGWTPLLEAADEGQTAIMELLLDRGARVDQGNRDGWTPLMEAAEEGHYEMAKLLLDKGAKPDQTNDNGVTALMHAADEGRLEMTKLLIDRGADVNFQSKEGFTALLVAIDEGHQRIVQLLLDNGARTELKGEAGNMALLEAIDERQLEVLQMLLDKNGNPNAANEDGWSLLMEAADEGYEDVVRTLVDNGANVNQTNDDGVTALMVAADEGHLDVVRILIDGGANVNQITEDGVDAILTATDEGHTDVVRFLLDSGVDFKARGPRILMEAADEGHLHIVKILLDKGVDPNAEIKDGGTAFLEAIDEHQMEIVRLFLDNGADPNARSGDGQTGLMEAADERDVKMAQLLLDHGADVNVKDDKGRTALMEAADESSEELVKLFLEKGADVNAKTTGGWIDGWADEKFMRVIRGWTALFEAIDERDVSVAEILIKNGADVNATMEKAIRNYQRDRETIHENWTPLMEAVEREQKEMVELLLRSGADVGAVTKAGVTVLDVANQTGNRGIIQAISAKTKK